jgi:putative membrane protein
MKQICILILSSAFCACPAMLAGQNTQTPDTQNMASLSSSERQFVNKAAEGGLAEVELGRLASEKASDPMVKQFGQRMVDDHSKANDQLKHVANGDRISLPEHLSARDKMEKEKLSKLSGEQFDRAYMKDMVNDHEQDVAEFRHESHTAKDPAIQAFASSTLPTLESHLKEAESIASKVDKSGT